MPRYSQDMVAIVDLRIDEVYAMLLEGRRTADIVRELSAKFEVTPRTLYNYIDRAEARLAEEVAKLDRRAELRLALEKYRILYARMYDAGDFRGAASMVDRIVSLLALNIADNLQVDWRAEAVQRGVDPGELMNRIVLELAGGAK